MEFGSSMGEPRRALWEWKLLGLFLDPKAAFPMVLFATGVIGLIFLWGLSVSPTVLCSFVFLLKYKQNRRLLGLLWI